MRSTSRGSLVALLLLLAGCGSTTVKGTADATPAPDVTAEPGDTPGKPDAQSVCFVDFPCAPWQRFTMRGRRAVVRRWFAAVRGRCAAGADTPGGVCSPSGRAAVVPAGTRCVMFADDDGPARHPVRTRSSATAASATGRQRRRRRRGGRRPRARCPRRGGLRDRRGLRDHRAPVLLRPAAGRQGERALPPPPPRVRRAAASTARSGAPVFDGRLAQDGGASPTAGSSPSAASAMRVSGGAAPSLRRDAARGCSRNRPRRGIVAR